MTGVRRLFATVGAGAVVTALSLSATAADYHVTTDGTPQGDGSEGSPWDLATALAQPSAVAPGDTIWLHDGTYEGSFVGDLDGAEGDPIVVRSAPGEWARIDGATSTETTFEFGGSHAWYWGFEITNTEPDRWGGRPEGVRVLGPELKLINLVIHDLGNNGFWNPAENLEVYGCLIYHNGYDDTDRGHGHGVYTQNSTGTKVFEDNVIFGGYSFGIHAYTEGGSIQGFDVIGNTWFNAGVISSVSGHKDDCLIGGLQPAARIDLRENLSWASSPTARTVQLGYSVPNEDVSLADNTFVGETNFSEPWTTITMTGNTFYSSVVGVDTASYPNNTYLAEAPTTDWIFVRPNRYEERRAHITAYDWDGDETVAADLSEVLSPGDSYELRNAQAYFEAPVATGTYDGSPIAIPMANLEPAQPIGTPGALDPSDRTDPDFNVFVLIGTEGEPIDPPDGGAGGASSSSGAGGSSSSSSGTGGANSSAPTEDSSCGCRLVGGATVPRVLGALALAFLGAAAIGRRRRQPLP